LFTGVSTSKPNARDEIRRDFFERVEIFIQRQQDEHIFLSTRPGAFDAMVKQAADEFWYQVIVGLSLYQRLKQYAVGSPIRIHDQPASVAVVGDKVCRSCRLGRAVHKEMNDRIGLDFRIGIICHDG
jgi:hypothetical protein